MNILVLQGSPRKKGNTAALQQSFLKGISSAGNHEIKEVTLQGLNIKPCAACDSCAGLTDRYCVSRDDMTPLYEEFLQADLIVFSTPVYWWSMSAQLKLFIDRLYALNQRSGNKGFKGKNIVLILAYGGEDPNSGADLVVNTFEDISEYNDWKIKKVIRYCSKDTHVSDNPEKLEEAYETGRELAAL